MPAAARASQTFLTSATFLHAQRSCAKLNVNWQRRCNRESSKVLPSGIAVRHVDNLAMVRASAAVDGRHIRTGQCLVWESLFSSHAALPSRKQSKKQRRCDSHAGVMQCALMMKVDWSAATRQALDTNADVGADAYISRFVGDSNSAASSEMLAAVRRFCMQFDNTLQSAVGDVVHVRVRRLSINIPKAELASCAHFAAQGFVLMDHEHESTVVMTCFIEEAVAASAGEA